MSVDFYLNRPNGIAPHRLYQMEEVEGELASATDLINTWAREYGVPEAQTPLHIREVIKRLWYEVVQRDFEAKEVNL